MSNVKGFNCPANCAVLSVGGCHTRIPQRYFAPECACYFCSNSRYIDNGDLCNDGLQDIFGHIASRNALLYIWAAFLCGSETWTITKSIAKKINALEM